MHACSRSRALFGPWLLFLAAGCAGAPVPDPGAEAPARAERMRWWREARFGLFIHWGLYAVPAGEWQDGTDHGEWIRDSARIPVAEYEQFQARFDPIRFDADQWVALAREAGMRYLVITSKHHDGFGLFDSAETDWDVLGTPFRRDILAELSAACARGGVRFCTYHSIMDWHHPDYLPRRPWEAQERPAAGADFERFEDYLHAQVTEVITKYHPGVLWFDGEWENTWTHARGVELYELCRALDPELIVNNRVDVHRGGMAGFSEASEAVGDFGTPEQEIPASGLSGVDWETCMTMNDHWGWNKSDRDWKSVETLVRNLIDVASKGGNYLLNVGPKADGTFPDEAIERLRGIGAWMKQHGDAIYGTSASPFEELPWGRCTMKRVGELTHLYLHVFERPPNGKLVLPGLGNEPNMASWLPRLDPQLPVRREGTDVVVELPHELPDQIASVVQLCVWGEPIVYRAPEIDAEADIFVRPLPVELKVPSGGLEIRFTLDGTEPDAHSTLYDRPLQLTESTELSARSFHRGQAVSAVSRRRFERVEPRAGITRKRELPHPSPGVRMERFEGSWDALPDLSQLSPVASTASTSVSLGPEQRSEYSALRFRGALVVPEDDVYVFSLTSDDGSDLWIGEMLVIDNDGLHGTLEMRGHIALAAGLHALEVNWFNKTGGAELTLEWAPLGGKLQPVTELVHPARD